MFKNLKLTLLAAAAFLACLFELLSLVAVRLPQTESFIIFGVLILLLGYPIIWRGIRDAIALNLCSVSLLVICAVLGGYAIGDYVEATVVMLLCALAGRLDHFEKGHEKSSLDELLEQLPRYAYIKGMDEPIDVSSIVPGQEIVIKPNHTVPLDGEIVSGNSSVDEGVITGNFSFVEKRPGDCLFAGSFNRQGTLLVRVLQPLNTSVLAQMHTQALTILQNKKLSPRGIENWLGYCAPLILGCVCFVLFFLWSSGVSLELALKSSLRFLLISTPSAMLFAGPVTTLFGALGAQKVGVRIAAPRAFEELARVKVVVFTEYERWAQSLAWKKRGISSVLLSGTQTILGDFSVRHRGVKGIKTGLLPEEKVRELEQLEKAEGVAAVVGEGISDILLLSAARVGFSVVPSLESSVGVASMAIEEESLARMPLLVSLAQRSLALADVNVIFAVIFKIIEIMLLLFGAISSPGAIFLEVVCAFLITANSARLYTSLPAHT